MLWGYVSGYVSRYVSYCWALDERDVVGVCIEVCIGVCIGGVKHASLHEFLTCHFWRQPYVYHNIIIIYQLLCEPGPCEGLIMFKPFEGSHVGGCLIAHMCKQMWPLSTSLLKVFHMGPSLFKRLQASQHPYFGSLMGVFEWNQTKKSTRLKFQC